MKIATIYLFDKIIDSNMFLRSDEEVGPARVEQDALDLPLGFGEGELGPPLRQLVDHDGPLCALGQHRGKVVALPVPRDLLHRLEVVDDDKSARRILVPAAQPLDRLRQTDRRNVAGVVGLLGQQLRGPLVDELVSHPGVDQQHLRTLVRN